DRGPARGDDASRRRRGPAAALSRRGRAGRARGRGHADLGHRPGVDAAQRAEPAAAGGRAADGVADPGAAPRPAGRGRARPGRVHRLARRLPGPALAPDLPRRPDAGPGRRPALHPGRRALPGRARGHPLVAGGAARRPRRDDHRPGAAAANPRVLLPARPLPRQGGHLQPALRLPADPARGRGRARLGGGRRARLGLRAVGRRPVLVGGTALPRPDPRAAPRRPAPDQDGL
ncbi:MAG: CDP-diacylglycerol--glycerol-3-phosphate 3-phosphatidyltransferase, partial [uncultured Friedmanniella sp.]